mmetsp:Transcript_30546/g.52133  ORF Transcript_30546/g.52133 Transcript_30546/m.52133 type:complete len:149 (+) Transcript_30546:372-818(+)
MFVKSGNAPSIYIALSCPPLNSIGTIHTQSSWIGVHMAYISSKSHQHNTTSLSKIPQRHQRHGCHNIAKQQTITLRRHSHFIFHCCRHPQKVGPSRMHRLRIMSDDRLSRDAGALFKVGYVSMPGGLIVPHPPGGEGSLLLDVDVLVG